MKIIQPNWPAPSNIKAYTTLRNGWGSSAHYHSAVETEKLKKLCSLSDDPIWVKQIHGITVLPALPAHQGQAADATYGTAPQQVCVVLTADCLPLLICNQQGSKVAAVHAGWRGLANGIVPAAIAALAHPPEELLVWLGPAIGPNWFEVGTDVYTAFTAKSSDAASAFTPLREGKWLANLYALAKLQLHHLGVTQIFGGDYCTYTQADLFFSYRRDQGNTGRMASLIWMDS